MESVARHFNHRKRGFTNAYVPLGWCATTKKIADYFDDHYFSHGHTYESHPITLAPAIAAINEIKRLNLIDRANEIGSYLGQKLNDLKKRHPSIGDVRGIGLFWCVELVKNQSTKEPFNTFKDKLNNAPLFVDKITMEMMKNGFYILAWISHFIIVPPLIISKGEIDQGIKALDESLIIADREVV